MPTQIQIVIVYQKPNKTIDSIYNLFLHKSDRCSNTQDMFLKSWATNFDYKSHIYLCLSLRKENNEAKTIIFNPSNSSGDVYKK